MLIQYNKCEQHSQHMFWEISMQHCSSNCEQEQQYVSQASAGTRGSAGTRASAGIRGLPRSGQFASLFLQCQWFWADTLLITHQNLVSHHKTYLSLITSLYRVLITTFSGNGRTDCSFICMLSPTVWLTCPVYWFNISMSWMVRRRYWVYMWTFLSINMNIYVNDSNSEEGVVSAIWPN